ncbi:MAG: hypothetical protein IPK83_21280 [Planctomycetes bacterium]|nr:hypothetical protein [Planctomycetota bacterium]
MTSQKANSEAAVGTVLVQATDCGERSDNSDSPERPPGHVLQGLREDPCRERYGGCPQCGRTSRFLVLWGDNWFVCREHRTRWCIGNMFEALSWERKAAATIARYLSFFREVTPAYDPDAES